MEIERQISDLQEILNILDRRIGNFQDKLAKWIFKKPEFLRGLVLMLEGDIVQQLDFEQAKVVHTNIVDDTLRETVSDMVFTVPFQDTSKADELTIYILLEHQSTVDRLMGYRLLTYMCQIWHAQLEQLSNADVTSSQRQLRPILPIVFYTGTQRWRVPVSLNAVMDVPEKMAPYVPTFKTLLLNVKNMDPEELTQTDHPFAWLMTVLQKELADEESMQVAMKTALTELEALKKENPGLHRNALIYLSLIVRFQRPEIEQTQLIGMINTQTEDKEVENIIMTGAEALIQQGLEQGLEQGRLNEKKTVVLKLLRHRFTDMPDTVINEITAIEDLGHLDALFDQVLAAESFDEIDIPKNSHEE